MKLRQHGWGVSVVYVPAIALACSFASCVTQLPSPQQPPSIPALAPVQVAQPPPGSKPAPAVHQARVSWYGRAFAGHMTSSGERYNPDGLTAASKTLPLGTVVKVSNPSNGKSVRVRINDRGPFVRGRSLDLSRGAAKKLGILHRGVTQVKVEKLNSPWRAQQREPPGHRVG